MAFELDPIFHTETMVKILQNQGHLFHAARICEKVLAKDPENSRLQALLEGIRKNPFKTEKTSVTPEDEVTDPGTPVEALAASATAGAADPSPEKDLKQAKLQKLYRLLTKVKERS